LIIIYLHYKVDLMAPFSDLLKMLKDKNNITYHHQVDIKI